MLEKSSVSCQVSSAVSIETPPNTARAIAISTRVTTRPTPPPVEEVQAVQSSTRMAAQSPYRLAVDLMALPPIISSPWTDLCGRSSASKLVSPSPVVISSASSFSSRSTSAVGWV